jgi:sugar lactone lactonase YvrE
MQRLTAVLRAQYGYRSLCRIAVIAAVFALISACLATPADAQSIATFSDRANYVVNTFPSTATAMESDSVQSQLWAAEGLYMKGLDSQAKTLLLYALPQLYNSTNPGDSSFNLIAAVDVLERWSSHFQPSGSPTPDYTCSSSNANLPDNANDLPTAFYCALTNFAYWNTASTSNQLLIESAARYLASQMYPSATFASGFSSTDPTGANYLTCYIQQIVTENIQEYDSDVYTGPYFAALRATADFAQSSTVRNEAALAYDWLLTNAASVWQNSTWVSTSYRRYFDIAPQDLMEDGSWMLWPLFGGPQPAPPVSLQYMEYALQYIATCDCVSGLVAEDSSNATLASIYGSSYTPISGYTPHQEILDLLMWPGYAGSYEFQARAVTPSSSTYQFMQDSYIASNYALFGETDYETSNNTKNGTEPPSTVLSGVVWNPSTTNAPFPSLFYAGAPRWQVDTTSTGVTGCPEGSYDCAVSNHSFGFGAHGQYFQSGNVQLGVYDYDPSLTVRGVTVNEPNQFYIYAPLCTSNQYPWNFANGNIPNFPCTAATVPTAMITSETSTLGHLYLYYDNVLISLWVSAPFTWDGLHELSFFDPTNATINPTAPYLASAIEVASPTDPRFAGSTPVATLANFQAYVDANASWNINGLTNSAGLTSFFPSATYTSSSGQTLANVFEGANSLNGTAIDYVDWPLIYTPWAQQTWNGSQSCTFCFPTHTTTPSGVGGGGNLTVTSPVTGNQLLYNFSTWTVTETLASTSPQTITFAAPASPVAYGSALVSLSATASSGLAVTLSVASGPASISGSTLTLTGAGTVVVAASQAGNSSYLAAYTVQQTIVVSRATDSVGTSATQPVYVPSATSGSIPVTVTGEYSGTGISVPTGSVNYTVVNSSNTTVASGSATLSSGVASIPVSSSLANGIYTVNVSYTGDGNYLTSSVTPITLQVGQITPVIVWPQPDAISPTTALGGILDAVASSSGLTVAGTYAYTATISGGSPVTVTSSSMLAAGSYALNVLFTPSNTATTTSASGSVSLNVTSTSTTVALTSPVTSLASQSQVLLTATVTGSSPTGTVTFYAQPSGGSQMTLTTATLSGNTATYTGMLPLGADSLTAVYSGDTDNTAATSSAVTVVDGPQLPEVFIAAIANVAGKAGTAGWSGDAAAAAGAELNAPRDIAFDASGDMYIADGKNDVIRMVYEGGSAAASLLATLGVACASGCTHTTPVVGDIYTIAGAHGTVGNTGDGGLASAAYLNSPYAVAVDGSGNIYIADTSNNRVRKITASTGIISNFAGSSAGTAATPGTVSTYGNGGAATSALLDYPTSLAIDNSNDVYIADAKDCEIRMVFASTANISAVAGTGSCGYTATPAPSTTPATTAKLSNPYGIALDASGNLYISDVSNAVIQLVSASTGYITTVVGNHTAGTAGVANGNGGLATSAELVYVWKIAVDRLGNLVISDTNGYQVRYYVPSTGYIYALAGTGTSGDSPSSTAVSGAAVTSALNYPYGIAADPLNNIYFADASNNVIRKIDASAISPYAGVSVGATGVAQPFYAQVTSADTVSTFQTASGFGDFTSGTESGCTLGSSNAVGTVCVEPVTFAPLGPGLRTAPLVITDSTGSEAVLGLAGIGKAPRLTFTPGTISTLAGTGTAGYTGDGSAASSATLSTPTSTAVDSAGNIYIADTANNAVRMINASSGDISTIAGTGVAGYTGNSGAATGATLNAPAAIAMDAGGNLYIADTGNNVIRKVSAGTGVITTVAGNGTSGSSGNGGAAGSAELASPAGIAVDLAGNLYISDTGNGAVRAVNSLTGNIMALASITNPTGISYTPNAAAITGLTGIYNSPSGVLLVASSSGNTIQQISLATSTVTTVAGNGTAGYVGDGSAATSAELYGPVSAVEDAAGNIYIADKGNSVLRRVDAATGTISTVAGNGTSGYTGDGGGAASAELAAPAGVALDGAANIYVADSSADVLRKVAVGSGVLAFGNQTVNTTSSSQTLVVTNTGNLNLTFSALSVPSNFAQLTGDSNDCTATTTLAASASCFVRLTFTPTSADSVSLSLTITSNTLNTTTTSTALLTGTGTD